MRHTLCNNQKNHRQPLSFCYRWAICIAGAVLFGYAFFRILFPDVTKGYWWDRNPLYGLSAVAALFVGALVLWAAFLLADRLKEQHLNKAVLVLMLLACIFCILCIWLFSIEPSWDYGVILHSSLELSQKSALTDPVYFLRYPFQVYPLLYLTFYMKLFHVRTMAAACAVSYVLNTVHILLAIYGAYFVGKLCRGERFGLKILLLCIGSAPIFLYASICYTDTLALPCPVWTLAIWLYARKIPLTDSKQRRKKALCYLGSGMVAGVGLRIKSVAAIGLIAIILFLLFDRAEQKGSGTPPAPWKQRAVKKAVPIFLLLAGFLVVVTSSSLIAKAAGYGEMHDDRYTYPMTHWFMMGANRETAGGYYQEDDLFTRSIPTYEERQKQTTARFVERLRMDGVFGYLDFLMDKTEAILSTGDYQAAGKLAQHPLVTHQALASYNAPLAECYLVYQQGFHAVILFSLLMGVCLLAWRPDGWIFRLSGMMLIGVVLFLLLWEGKARYLLFLVPVINIAAAAGFSRFQKCVLRLLELKKANTKQAID